MNEKMLEAAKAAQSPEELLKMAHENGMEDFTEENAKAYFETMHKSGELSDDELECAAGGCKKGGRTVVTVANSCPHWRCEKCNELNPSHDLPLSPRSYYLPEGQVYACDRGRDGFDESAYHKHYCHLCYYCSYEGAMWYCNNAIHNAE